MPGHIAYRSIQIPRLKLRIQLQVCDYIHVPVLSSLKYSLINLLVPMQVCDPTAPMDEELLGLISEIVIYDSYFLPDVCRDNEIQLIRYFLNISWTPLSFTY
jgi:hypothetical protein